MGSSQRGCCNNRCQGGLEDDIFEKEARERRLKRGEGETATSSQPVNSQPLPANEMASSSASGPVA
jgi:hypothetical protein